MIAGCFYNNWLCTLFWVAHLIYGLHKESSNFHLVYDVFLILLDTCIQGCERSSFNLGSDYFMLHKPPFRTLGALKCTSFQAFKIVLRLLTDALTPLFTWIKFFRYRPAIIDVLDAGFKVICMCYIGVLGLLAYVPVIIFIQAPLKRDTHNLRVFYKVLQLCTI